MRRSYWQQPSGANAMAFGQPHTHRRHASIHDAYPRRPLPGGGDGGNYGSMEARVARLEEDMKEIKADLKGIRGDLQYLRGKVDSLPSTMHLLGFVIAVLGIAGLAKYFAP